MITAKNKLGIVFFPAYDWAISPTHPEREERLLYTQDQLREEGIFDIEGIDEYKPDIASIEDIARVHFCVPDVEHVITESHLISAGGAIRAGRLVMEKKADKAFALVRPPGHHAMKVVHGNRGFCNVNIEAVMIEHLREQYGPLKVAIVDTDCHHGDGTQDIYWHDPDTLFISIHQDGRTLYPGSGFANEIGGPNARGRTINIPLPPQSCDGEIIHMIDNAVLPILDHFKPDLIINSAGQDNHYTDPITDMCFTARGYALLNEKLNPHIAVLEGGYSIQGALPYVNLGIILAMAGLDYSHVKEPDYDTNPLLRTCSIITDELKELTDKILKNYFHPETEKHEKDSFSIRNKEIFYDTDDIRESQVEKVMYCTKCAGISKIETRSSINSLSSCIEIPIKACDLCRSEGVHLYRDDIKSKKYKHVIFINRRDRVYLQK